MIYWMNDNEQMTALHYLQYMHIGFTGKESKSVSY